MSINFQKYDHIQFHEDEAMNKKIKAYMIIFDYQVEQEGLTDKECVEHLNTWEEIFLVDEFYEIIPSIIYRREKIEKRIKHDSLTVVGRMAYKLSDILRDIINSKK